MKTLLLILAVLAMVTQAYGNNKDFCEDTKAWKYFEAMTEKYPEDIPLQLLHALKIGLCEKVSDNTIRLDAAITIFNSMVDVVANKREETVNKDREKL